MKLRTSKIGKFQEGGAMPPAPEQAPAGAPQEGQDPIMVMAETAQVALETQDCQAAFSVCEIVMQLVQGAQGGAAPEAAPAEGPAFARKGAKLVRKR